MLIKNMNASQQGFYQYEKRAIDLTHVHTCIFKLINKVTFKAVRTSVVSKAHERQKCFIGSRNGIYLLL